MTCSTAATAEASTTAGAAVGSAGAEEEGTAGEGEGAGGEEEEEEGGGAGESRPFLFTRSICLFRRMRSRRCRFIPPQSFLDSNALSQAVLLTSKHECGWVLCSGGRGGRKEGGGAKTADELDAELEAYNQAREAAD